MAKAAPTEQVKPNSAEENPEKPKRSKKKLFLTVGIALLVLGIGGTAGALYLNKKNVSSISVVKYIPVQPPVFINLESFTVNLQAEDGDQYLQITFTLQVKDEKQVETIKQHMPQVRSRLLMLLSSKKASEIASTEGKKKLSDEIIALIQQPFNPQGEPQSVSSVFFTSFIIQ